MNWEFTIQSPDWIPWVFVIGLIVIVGGLVWLYMWVMRRYFYLLGSSAEGRKYGPVRIRPFWDVIELKPQGGSKIGRLARKPDHVVELEEGFRFRDGGHKRKVKTFQNLIIVSENGDEEYYFNLQPGKETNP